MGGNDQHEGKVSRQLGAMMMLHKLTLILICRQGYLWPLCGRDQCNKKIEGFPLTHIFKDGRTGCGVPIGHETHGIQDFLTCGMEYVAFIKTLFSNYNHFRI